MDLNVFGGVKLLVRQPVYLNIVADLGFCKEGENSFVHSLYNITDQVLTFIKETGRAVGESCLLLKYKGLSLNGGGGGGGGGGAQSFVPWPLHI